jgi:signal transduction histidine kinase
VAADEPAQSRAQPTALEQAERSLAIAYLATRAGQLVFSTLMVAADRKRFKHPKLQLALLGAAAAESAWFGYRLVRAGRYRDRTVMWTDTVSAAAGLIACEAGLGAQVAAPWMKNMVIGAALGAASADSATERTAAIGLLGAAGVWSGVHAQGRDAHVAGLMLALNDLVSWSGQYAAARLYVESQRRDARLRDEADALAVERARVTAAETERIRQHQLVHRATLDALQAIAHSTDRTDATARARKEAARLRHVLRTRGEIPTGLESALLEVAAEAATLGVRVELVSVELSAEATPSAADAVCNAVRDAIAATREYDHVDRAVVRASGAGAELSVTFRSQGPGFVVEGGSAYERDVTRSTTRLREAGGTLEVWSKPGRGVRITIVVPAVERAANESAHRLPDGGIGWRGTGDDDRAIRERDIDRRTGNRLVGATQVGVGPVGTADNLDVRLSRETDEAGAQQRLVGNDVHCRTGHQTSMNESQAAVVGRTTPLEADRAFITALLAWRFAGLATGLAALVGGRARYRSRALAAAAWSLTAIESCWLLTRLTRREPWARADAARADAVTALAGVALTRANLAPEDRATWLNWAPWTLGASAMAAQGIRADHAPIEATGAALAVGVNTALAPRTQEFAANAAGLGSFFVAGRVLARQLRRGASQLDHARDHAEHEGARLAAERERARQLRLLHDRAVQTLEAIGSGRDGDLAAVRSHAAEEAAHLERELAGHQPVSLELGARVEQVVVEQRTLGLDVTIDVEVDRSVAAELVDALCDASREALTNVRKHAHATNALVTVRTSSNGTTVVIEDDGVGFEPTVASGFGIAESIGRRMRDSDGTAVVSSARGHGTRVTLWGPG